MSSYNIVENELIESEATYVNELSVLISTYVEPLEKYVAHIRRIWDGDSKYLQNPQHSSPLLLLEQILFDEHIDVTTALFANIKAIHTCNSILLSAMKDSASPTTITPTTSLNGSGNSFPAVAVLLKHMPFIKIYANYAANFEYSNALLTRLEKGDAR
jgi:hypothetical protein